MPLPLIPIAIAAAAGIGLEKGLSSLFDDAGDVGTKKGGLMNEFHEPYENYSPTITDMRQVQLPDYQVQIDSPFGSQDMTKKQSMEPDISAGISQTEGTNMPLLVGLGVVGVIVYGVVTK